MIYRYCISDVCDDQAADSRRGLEHDSGLEPMRFDTARRHLQIQIQGGVP